MNCLTATQRAARLEKQAVDLGLKRPTESMISEAIRDAEWNAIWHPVEVATYHDLNVEELRHEWKKLADFIRPRGKR